MMHARMIINTESTVGYNNKLKQALMGIKLGVNTDVNHATKKAGHKLMERERGIKTQPTKQQSSEHTICGRRKHFS